MRRLLPIGVLAAVLLMHGPARVGAQSDETYRLLSVFGEAFERVREEYVEEVADQELIEAAIEGMLSSLDPHSGYLSPDSFDEMQVQTKGEFGGLGMEVTMEDGFIKVVSPIDDTPAFHAGMQAGDFITQLDGEQVLGLSLREAVDRMRGPVGTDIELTVMREGLDEPLFVTITRDIITIRSVRWRLEDEIGYIRITTFSEQTEDGLVRAVDDIEAELGDRLQGIVLDLRNNPGGLLEQARAVADLFLERGEIVSIRGRRQEGTKRYNARSGDIVEGLPIVTLINGGSASASEIVAGALQDHGRAIVLGEHSFGKGSVQTIMPLPHGAMRLTTARYYTPSGTSIQARGITPDILAVATELPRADEDALDRSEASLRNSLEAEGDEVAVGQRSEESRGDYQLNRALDLIEGLALLSGGATGTE